jgi:hypothetical protein
MARGRAAPPSRGASRHASHLTQPARTELAPGAPPPRDAPQGTPYEAGKAIRCARHRYTHFYGNERVGRPRIHGSWPIGMRVGAAPNSAHDKQRSPMARSSRPLHVEASRIGLQLGPLPESEGVVVLAFVYVTP